MIQYEIINGVGKITLNRPDKYHSFVREMALQLQGTLDKCNENKAVRAILITATGKAFCAGQDLGEANRSKRTRINTNRTRTLQPYH